MKKRTLVLTLLTFILAIGLMSSISFAGERYPDRIYYTPTISVNKTAVKAGEEYVYTVKQAVPREGMNGWIDFDTFTVKILLPDQATFVSATFENADLEAFADVKRTIGPGGQARVTDSINALYKHDSDKNTVLLDAGVIYVGYGTFNITIKAKAAEAGNPKNWYTKVIHTADDEVREITMGVPDTPPEHEHNLIHVAGTDPTCTQDGSIAYYHCTDCGKNYKNADGTRRLFDTTAKALGHAWQKTPIKKATLTSDGTLALHCTRCGIDSEETILKPTSFTLAATALSYDSKAKTPAIIVINAKGERITSFTVAYTNNKAIGTATATVAMNGNYTGSKALTFRINPPGTTLKKLIKGKKALTVKWNKKAYSYQIQYSLKKNFASAKTVTVKKAKTISKKIGKLKAKKKYYVRIRTFKKVGAITYVSPWSAAKSAKTK